MWYSEAPSRVHRGRGKRVRTLPFWLDAANEHAPDAVPYPSLLALIRDRKPKTIGLRRTFALGDVLLAVPVVRAFQRATGCSITFITRRDFYEMFRRMDIPGVTWAKDRGRVNYGADCHFCLNSCLELDHRGGPESDMHRCNLYAAALGYKGLNYRRAA